MRYPLTLLVMLCLSLNCIAQTEIIGKVLTTDDEPLIGVTVILLATADSSMTSFGITNADGRYRLEDVNEGEYLIQLSFVSYKTLTFPLITNWNGSTIDAGYHKMEVQNELLVEVTIEAERIPLGIKGDTITYNTSAFKTRAGASVEDLLKQLPGIEVARDGSIKAQGEDVENVLVDGKEFFGDDPTIATKNLEAVAVDEVEVFDKLSEMAEFTGVDDGQDEKTINLKLKEEYKVGGFGRVKAEGGSSDRYLGKLNYNRFSPSMQASTIIANNNINEQAFSFNDYVSMMGGLSNAIANNNGILNFGEFGGSGGQIEGLTNNLSGGLNFNYDFSDKLELKSHYFYIRNNKNIDRLQNGNLFDNTINYNSENTSQQNDLGQNHRFQSKLLYKPNPRFQVLLKNNLLGVLADNQESSTTNYTSQSVNSSTLANFNVSSNQIGYDGHLQLRKKYVTKGRNWINNIKYKSANITQQNDVLNELNLGSTQQVINQLQTYDSHEEDISIQSEFTNPIGNRQYLTLSYYFNQNVETPTKLFFDRELTELVKNELLSASFRKEIGRHSTKASYRYNGNKIKTSMAVTTQWSGITSQLLDLSEEINNTAFNLLPTAMMEYKFTDYKRLSINYNTSINLPSLTQLTPLPDNTDPNLFILGNPNLDPEYRHQVSFNFSSFDNFSQRNFLLYGHYMNIRDKIINAVRIDESFIRTIQPINTDGYTTLSINASYGAPIRPLKIKYSLRADLNLSSYETLLNNATSGVNEDRINISLTIENRKKKHIDIRTGVRYNLSHRRYSLNSDFDQTFGNYALFADATVETDNGWSINSTFDWNSYSNEFFAEAQTFSLWNATVRKSFKEDQYALTMTIYDILGQNIGLSRSGGLNSLNETRFNTLTRYAMIGFSYKLGRARDAKGTIKVN